MVNFGSEARGYSLMLLAALAFLWLAAEAVEGREKTGTRWWLALVAALGMLSHMTMAAPVGLIALWVYLERRAALGPAAAMRDSARLMAPAFVASAAVVLFVFAAAAASPTGMQLGGYIPFTWREFFAGLNDMTGWTAGLERPARLGRAGAVGGSGVVDRRFGRRNGSVARARLYAILILGVPLGAALVQSGNSGFARYYLASAIGLLLLESRVDRARAGQATRGPRRRRNRACGVGVGRAVARFRADRAPARTARRRGRADDRAFAERRPRRARTQAAGGRADARRAADELSARHRQRLRSGRLCLCRAGALGADPGGDRPLRNCDARARLVGHQLAHRRSLGAVRRGKLANRWDAC